MNYATDKMIETLTMPLYADPLGPAYNGPRYPWKQAFTDGARRAKYEPEGPGVGVGWHDADVLPVPMLMPDLCPSLKGGGLTLADVTQAIYDVAEIRRRIGPEYDGEDVRRAMILSRLEAQLHEARPERGQA